MTEALKAELFKEAKRIEEDSVHSCKGNFHAARRWEGCHFWIGASIAILAGVTGVSAFNNESSFAGAIAFIIAGLTAANTFLDPKGISERHQSAGVNYNGLRNKTRIFYNIEIPSQVDMVVLKKILSEINEERDTLNKNSPKIPNWAYQKAKESINNGEADYEVDRADE